MKTDDRRQQIARAALGLLGAVPLAQLTTRMIARKVGVSQPALFRHFQSRDEILSEVVLEVRGSISELVATALEGAHGLEVVRRFVRTLFAYVNEHPGLPRLLFFDASDDEEASFHAPLQMLVSVQQEWFAELVRGGQRRGELAARVPPEEAATLLLSLIQGTLLQWLHGGRAQDLSTLAEPMVNFWITGLGGPVTSGFRPPDSPEPTRGRQPRTPRENDLLVTSLDVRPLLKGGVDPRERILETLNHLSSFGAMELITPFRPEPLLRLLTSKGYTVRVEQLEPAVFRVWIQLEPATPWRDLRQLEAPKPLERVLASCSRLQPGRAFLAVLPRFPRMLLPHLKTLDVIYQIQEGIDGCALACFRRPPHPANRS